LNTVPNQVLLLLANTMNSSSDENEFDDTPIAKLSRPKKIDPPQIKPDPAPSSSTIKVSSSKKRKKTPSNHDKTNGRSSSNGKKKRVKKEESDDENNFEPKKKKRKKPTVKKEVRVKKEGKAV